jgi:D-beta-D-heptose 7-phosphate kinase / D-beta-D-heptose 1-phosphate adenosyltransferase
VQGAGDTTMAALVASRGGGTSLFEACVVANAAAAIAVSKVGTAAPTRAELHSALPEALALALASEDA